MSSGGGRGLCRFKWNLFADNSGSDHDATLEDGEISENDDGEDEKKEEEPKKPIRERTKFMITEDQVYFQSISYLEIIKKLCRFTQFVYSSRRSVLVFF